MYSIYYNFSNSVPKKKSTKNLVVETTHSNTSLSERDEIAHLKSWNILSRTNNESQLSTTISQDNNNLNFNTQDITTKSDESKQKIEEFNNILNLVCSNKNTLLPPGSSNSSSQNCNNRSICNAGTFQDFATGVSESCDKERPIVPDSSTSETFILQNTRVDNTISSNQVINIKGPPKAQCLLKVGTPKTQNTIASNTNEQFNTPNIDSIKIKTKKAEDPKVKILSDVKIDKNLKGNSNIKPPLMKPVTSTPLFQMQTIVINGTPAYRNKPQTGTCFNYTRDEIMAMPTIILVPATGASQKTSVTTIQSSISQCSNTVTTTTASTTQTLGPLTIDISSNKSEPVPSSVIFDKTVSKDGPQVTSEVSSIQPIDVTHSSVPKDTNLTVSTKTSTPQALPPTRKSSSTPRRTSHVRVLDFTTPRRILHETINEQDPNKVMSQNIASSENTEFSHQDTVDNVKTATIQKADTNTSITNMSTKKNSIKIKKKNWDAELRALAIRNDDNADFTPKSEPEEKRRNIIKNKTTQKDENIEEITVSHKSKSDKNKFSPKKKKSKKRTKSVEFVEDPSDEKRPEDNKTPECTVKPTVNIIKDSDWNTLEPKGKTGQYMNPKNQTDVGKLNNSDEKLDTPENERLSLQNEIGARLNISDLLETPYKQVLYDIQMETPKFLGPDLPDEPISDIKIMNIPTPRFLATPKPLQATPSSYSSRPTDYSSGGSYYKPDDQDFIPASDVLEIAVTVTEEPFKDLIETPKEVKNDTKEKPHKTSRPQRKCTKNVSYRSLNVTARTKEIDNQEIASVSSETSNTSSREKKTNKTIETKSKIKSENKKDKKKVSITHKSPFKKETPKKYIRIKPFRKTPCKESPSKGRKNTSDLLQTLSSKSVSRKRTSTKEKSTTVVPVINVVTSKSRRKSSTPRKLDCTKSFSSDSVDLNSSDLSKNEIAKGSSNAYCPQDSDNEQQPLRWSDDGSQDAKPKETESTSNADIDDISKIKEFIETSKPKNIPSNRNDEGSLHIDLVKRGFDIETAKIIERDLLDTTPIQDSVIQCNTTCEISNLNKNDISKNISEKVESDNSISNNLQIVQDDIEEDIELSVYECTEESKNFITCEFDESNFVPKSDTSKLKDKFCMELCIEDGVSIRLRATAFKTLFEDDSYELSKEYSQNETEAAVNSISNMDKLYTPMKDRKAQCYEIFDSTLTSIDTPLKTENTKETIYETTITDIVLEVENIDTKGKSDTKKRKRSQSGISDDSINKKTKPDTEYLLNSANIQNIDIESVLSKLHGP
ncbi:unnamed protein product [Euphydryas editha]|uniref:Uncharacterized protein n=1 Tax=Euphydryas editha TaxID=104508 RepID=A0AAU9V4Q5_EUPED|nr:unnamed protein product [Euphydryas editha]